MVSLMVTGPGGSDTLVKTDYINVTEPTGGPIYVGVTSIIYDTSGGRNKDRHLEITMAVRDDQENAVSNANVSANIFRGDDLYASLYGATASDGTVIFKLANHPSGNYDTVVTGVSAAELIWDKFTPPNGYYKP